MEEYAAIIAQEMHFDKASDSRTGGRYSRALP